MRTIASFRLIHQSGGTARNVTERLGLEPTKVSEAGSPVSSRTPALVSTHSAWVLSSAPEPQDDVRLSVMLDRLLEKLEPVRAALWSLEQEGYWANWLCMLDVEDGEAATEIHRQTMQRLLTLPGDLWLDVHKDTSERDTPV
ncbi:MAG TPA: DUF4279 domain-containing protein [Kineosporiaceae bacterium]|nr:DUF4279 domain-containing protein [Kineosporiaceae bacterium]